MVTWFHLRRGRGSPPRLLGLLLAAAVPCGLGACDRKPAAPPPAAEDDPEGATPTGETLQERILWGLAAAPAADDPEARGSKVHGSPSVLFVDYASFADRPDVEARLGIGYPARELARPLGIPGEDLLAAWLLEIHDAGASPAIASVLRVKAPADLAKSFEARAAENAWQKQVDGDGAVYIPEKGDSAVAVVARRVIHGRTPRIVRWLRDVVKGRTPSMAGEADIREEVRLIEPGALSWFAGRSMMRYELLESIADRITLATSASLSGERAGVLVFRDAQTASDSELPVVLHFFEAGKVVSVSQDGARLRVRIPHMQPSSSSRRVPATGFGKRFLWGAAWCPAPEAGKGARCLMTDLKTMRRDGGSAWPGAAERAVAGVRLPGVQADQISAIWECYDRPEGDAMFTIAVLEDSGPAALKAWAEGVHARGWDLGPFHGYAGPDGEIRGICAGAIVSARDEATLLRVLRARAGRSSLATVGGVARAADETPEGCAVGELAYRAVPSSGEELEAGSFAQLSADSATRRSLVAAFESVPLAEAYVQSRKKELPPESSARREGVLVILEMPRP